MESCPECGCSRIHARVRHGIAVRECDLCGALVDDDPAAQQVRLLQAARAHGADPLLWPLLQTLGELPGLRVLASHFGDAAALSVPFVQWSVSGAGGLLQVENVAKSLALAARSHRLHWVLEAEYLNCLAFTLKPRVDPAAVSASIVAAARADLQALHEDLARNRRLSWWHRP